MAKILYPDVCPDSPENGLHLSTWGISLAFHGLLLLVLALVLGYQPVVTGVSTDRTATVGIVLKTEHEDRTLYESADNASKDQDKPAGDPTAAHTENPNAATNTLSELSALVSSNSAADIPTLDSTLVGAPPSSGDGKSGLENITDGIAGAQGIPSGTFGQFGRGTVSCFNTTGEGSRFSFVFDRSGSMGGPGFSPIMAAKAELMRALQSLQSNQQFQIIFYNERASIFSPKRLLLATDQNRREAMTFLAAMTADGGTNHKEALHMAIAQHPDVIFFLTDADEPPLSAAELSEIKRNATGTQINAIQFGDGEDPGRTNFLKRLAEQNGGQYIYVNIRSLRKQ